jgi:uncharacterized protein YcbX
MAQERVEEIWRYPVKSMAGEKISSIDVTPRGLVGDRMFALVEPETNRVATVRTWASSLLLYSAQFVTEPKAGTPSMAKIVFPDGSSCTTDDPSIHKHFSAVFQRNLSLLSSAPAGLKYEVPAGTPGGSKASASDMLIAAGAPEGSFFDYGCIHLIATSTLDRLQELYPQGRFDVRRFRPNIVIRSQRKEPFIENSWRDRPLAIGDEVVLKVTLPVPRCVNVILPQADLPRDPGILRTVAQNNMCDLGEHGRFACIGVYANVVVPGTIRYGDAVSFV